MSDDYFRFLYSEAKHRKGSVDIRELYDFIYSAEGHKGRIAFDAMKRVGGHRKGPKHIKEIIARMIR